MNNVVLIGMPGAGKSTIGVILAKIMGMPFLDTDLTIQEQEGRLLQDIINEEGMGKFIEIEEAVILNIHVHKHVIATGGSVVYSHTAIEHLKKNSLVVYLQLPYEEILKRVNNIQTRGIAMKKGQTLLALYKERTPLYERYADMTIDCHGKDIEEVIRIIQNKLHYSKLPEK